MKKSAKTILGICTFGYLVLFVIFMCYMCSMMFSNMQLMINMNNDPHVFPREFFNNYLKMLPFIIVIGLSSLSLLIYYIVHVARLRTIETGERVMWILLFIFFRSIAFIIYFFVRVVPKPEPENLIQNPS